MGSRIPKEWRVVKLSDLGEVNRGRSRHRPRYAEHLYGGPYPFIQTGDIREANGRIVSHKQTYSEAGLSQSRLWPAGTMCITIAANIAETAVLTYPACFPDSVVGFIPDSSNADVRYIEYTFRYLKNKIQHEATGSVQDNINLETLERLQFPLPPLIEQQAIASILGALDDKIELNRQRNRTLEAMARALFQSWFVDFDPVKAKAAGKQPPGLKPEIAALFPDSFEESDIGIIPKEWRASNVRECFDLTMGQSPPGSTYNERGEGLPFYQGRSDFGFRFPTRRVFCSTPTRLANGGDTLVSVRAPVGDVNIANETCAIGRGVAAIRHKSGCRSIAYYAMKNLANHFLQFEAEGTVFGSINKTDFEQLPFCEAPDRIVETFSDLVVSFDDQIDLLSRETETLQSLRDSLLPKLISGELRIPDAERIVARTI